MAETVQNRSVGRPREFDEDDVLDCAMNAFWRKGYEATSMSDLCNCTGLHKGSLYQSFGDKHHLFMRSLENYADKQFSRVASVVHQSDSPLENIRAAVDKICDDAGSDKGCLMVNSLVELAPHDAEVKATLQAIGEKRVRFMMDLIGKAQEAGEIRPEQDPYKLARQLMVTLAGVAAMAKGFLEKDDISEIIDELFDSWT